MKTAPIVLAAWLMAVPPLQAQLVADGATNTLANVTNNIIGNVIVGTNGSFTLLVLSNNCLVTNTVSGFIGLNAAAKSNEVRLVSPTARWQMGGTLLVGNTGSWNNLVINGGAAVSSFDAGIGRRATSTNNRAIVSGAGSSLRTTDFLIVGVAGGSNSLEISGGGFVGSGLGSLGSSGSGNEALVSGSGSVWSNAADLFVGELGSNNRLTVSDAGWLIGNNGALGSGASVTNNQVVVTGSGSMWSNHVGLYVGAGGPRNRLEVNGGGWAVSSNTYVGYFGASNLALISGPGSTLSNRADLVIGQSSGNNRLVTSGGANVLVGRHAVIGREIGALSNSVLVTDAGSRWLIATNLFVGSNSPFNQLVVSNGGFVSNSAAIIGFNPTASNNVAIVTGAGSVWSNDLVVVGTVSRGNQLVVTNGGSIVSKFGILGENLFCDDNLVSVTGPGSVWSLTERLIVGSLGDLNRLVVSNGGQVLSREGIIGFHSSGNFGGRSNEVMVTGPGSLLSSGTLTVGRAGVATRLAVNNSGTVSVSNALLGAEITSTNNRVVVNGGTLQATAVAGNGFLDVRRGTNVLNAGLVEVDQLILTNTGIAIPTSFGNSSSNHIPNLGRAEFYPSTITVAGLAGAIKRVTVTFSNISHELTYNLDILLVGPAGQKVMLMSDVGGASSLFNRMLLFDDGAPPLPEGTSPFITNGTYSPTDYQPETMPTPAPTGPYSTNLSSFNGSNPNGVWSLYINDDGEPSSGRLLGWSVQIATDAGPFLESPGFELNGGVLVTRGAAIRNGLPFIVGGPGGVPAVWEARAGLSENVVTPDLLVGSNSSFNQMVIPSGVVSAGANVLVGASPSLSSNNLLHVDGGTLRVLHPNARFDVRGGTNRLDAGLVDVIRLVVTNTRGQIELNGGTLRTAETVVTNGRVFTVGGGANAATLQLLGGTHTFANNLTVATNGSLIGTGTIDGTVAVAPGGRLVPGAPIGSIQVLGSVILQGTVNLQIDKSGGVRTSDKVIADTAISYNGTLNVTDIGTDLLAAGDRFFLFDATPYLGAFTTLNLPPLGAGLAWLNKLTVDGSIEVVVASTSQPRFSSVVRSGANLIVSGTNGTPNAPYAVLTATNVSTPANNWQSLVTNQFGAGGQFSFTNAINPNEPQRYFRLRTP